MKKLIIIALLLLGITAQAAKITEYQFDGAYLYGYTDIIVAADEAITKEEVCAIMYRILKQNGKVNGGGVINNPQFLDVKADRWSYVAIEHMVKIHAITKSSDYFYPNRAISRGDMAKLTTVALGLKSDKKSTIIYKDLSVSNEYYSDIKTLTLLGVLQGYPDGTIRPNGNLTRSEFVKMINLIVNRSSDYEVDVNHKFVDIANSHWAYSDLIRATSAFEQLPNGKFKVNNGKRIERNKLDEYYQ